MYMYCLHQKGKGSQNNYRSLGVGRRSSHDFPTYAELHKVAHAVIVCWLVASTETKLRCPPSSYNFHNNRAVEGKMLKSCLCLAFRSTLFPLVLSSVDQSCLSSLL